MKQMSKFPSIEQYRNVIRHVQDATWYTGQDENGNPVFNKGKRLPTLKFKGTVKLHGTNAGVGYSFQTSEYWCQSRENIISIEYDNAGFAAFVYSKYDTFAELFQTEIPHYLGDNGYDITKYDGVVVYGEWCGGSIQKKVAINALPKMFVVFGIKLLTADEEANEWLPNECITVLLDMLGSPAGIFSIYDFPTFEIDIDFNEPEQSTNKLTEFTNQVEQQCPVGAHFGVFGLGEGIVWTCVTHPFDNNGYRFKVKGAKHQSSKVKTLAPVDIERVNSIKECVDQIVTENRLHQGLEYLTINHMDHIVENLGTFIKWVMSDCIKEELDTITGSGLSVKDVGGAVSKRAKIWFFETTQRNDLL
jgi:hypothetical protein